MLNETALTRPARPVNKNQVNTLNQPNCDYQDQDHHLWWFKYQNNAAIEALPQYFLEVLMEDPTESRLSQLSEISKDSHFLEYLNLISDNAYDSGYNDCNNTGVKIDPPLLRRWKTKIHLALIAQSVDASYTNGMLDV